MSDVIPTIKIKPSHKSQGAFVEINEDDFDPKQHEKLTAAELAKAEKADAKAADSEEQASE